MTTGGVTVSNIHILMVYRGYIVLYSFFATTYDGVFKNYRNEKKTFSPFMLDKETVSIRIEFCKMLGDIKKPFAVLDTCVLC